MLAIYASVLAISVASLTVGQAALAVCGRRTWSWLSPAVGLALLAALCWATVRLPGDGVVSAISVLIATAASVGFLRNRVEGLREAIAEGAPVAFAALLAASLPFLVEGRFGILGTSFNPDVSQHLLATDRLAQGAASQLLAQGYPLGPHAIVVTLNKGLGVGLVQGFGGLTLAISVLACLTALGALRELQPLPRWAAALLVGLPYIAASYLAQGAFKETMQALFVLAFAIGLLGISRARPVAAVGGTGPLVGIPLAILAVGSVYTYSFPGLTWLIGALGIWAIAELFLIARDGGGPVATLREVVRPACFALVLFVVLAAPEIGRMIDFASFETFNPNGPGLGNLFGQVSPAEALGVWPSGDFRLSAGDGAVPALAFYAGVAFAALLLAWGLVWWLRRRQTAPAAALAAAAVAYAAARAGGTPYTAAKAIEMAAPLAMLAMVRPLFDLAPSSRIATQRRQGRPGERQASQSWVSLLKPLAAAALVIGAGGCSLLALANGPVGPTSYSPGLAALRPSLQGKQVEIVASRTLLREEHGIPFLAWELRGTRLCFSEGGDLPPPPGVPFVITSGPPPASTGLKLQRRAGPYALYRRPVGSAGQPVCPLIAVRSARQGEKQGG